MAGLARCAGFEERPLAPTETAARLEERSQAQAGLRNFLDISGHAKGFPSPAKSAIAGV